MAGRALEALVSAQKSPKSAGPPMPLSEYVTELEARVRLLARDAGVLEYRMLQLQAGDADADATNAAYTAAVVELGREIARLDAAYAYRAKTCYQDVVDARAALAERAKKMSDYNERVRKLSIPPFGDDTKVTVATI